MLRLTEALLMPTLQVRLVCQGCPVALSMIMPCLGPDPGSRHSPFTISLMAMPVALLLWLLSHLTTTW